MNFDAPLSFFFLPAVMIHSDLTTLPKIAHVYDHFI